MLKLNKLRENQFKINKVINNKFNRYRTNKTLCKLELHLKLHKEIRISTIPIIHLKLLDIWKKEVISI